MLLETEELPEPPHRAAGTTSRHDNRPNGLRHAESEESVMGEHILDLDMRGFLPTKDMA